jgi:hypothetical protein
MNQRERAAVRAPSGGRSTAFASLLLPTGPEPAVTSLKQRSMGGVKHFR